MTKTKELLTLKELSARLTEELQHFEHATGSKISVQYMLQEPDPNGCNWSDSVVLTVGPDTTKENLIPLVERLVIDAQKKFNVKT